MICAGSPGGRGIKVQYLHMWILFCIFLQKVPQRCYKQELLQAKNRGKHSVFIIWQNDIVTNAFVSATVASVQL